MSKHTDQSITHKGMEDAHSDSPLLGRDYYTKGDIPLDKIHIQPILPIQVIWEKMHPDVQLPQVATSGSFAADIRAYLTTDKITLEPFTPTLIPTGLKADIPKDFALMITPRSGLALKTGLSLVNSPGIIDSDYTDEIGIIAINLTTKPIVIEHQSRIAQCYLQPQVRMPQVEGTVVPKNTERKGGFGSTGVTDTPKEPTPPVTKVRKVPMTTHAKNTLRALAKGGVAVCAVKLASVTLKKIKGLIHKG